MSNERKKRIRLTSPKGIAKFPWLTTPNTRFNPDGEYSVNLILDPNDEDVQNFLRRLDELADEAFEAAKDDLVSRKRAAQAKKVIRVEPYRMEVDQNDEETGMVEVKAKMKAKVETRDGRVLEFSPRLFDAQGKPIDPKSVSIYGGSVIRVNVTANPYFVPATRMAGISLQLNAVQIIELVSGGSGDASSFGFDVVDGGFSVDRDVAYHGDDNEHDDDDYDGDDIDEEDF